MLWNRKKKIEMCCERRYMKENVCEIKFVEICLDRSVVSV